MKLTRNLGVILLGIFLIVHGLQFLLTINIPQAVLPVLAIVTGIVVLLFHSSLRIRPTRSLGMILVSIWLIAHGLVSLFTVNVPRIHEIMSLFTLITGLVMMLYGKTVPVRLSRDFAMIMLGIFFVFQGVINLFDLGVMEVLYTRAIFAVVTGVVVLLFDKAATSAPAK
jgi:hypothetical protein